MIFRGPDQERKHRNAWYVSLIYLYIYGAYVAPFPDGCSEALPAQALGQRESLEQLIERDRQVSWYSEPRSAGRLF